VLTVVVVVVTANHYWVDAVVAALLLGLVLLVTPRPPEVPASQLWRRVTRRAQLGPVPVPVPSPVLARQAAETTKTGSVVGASDPTDGSTVRPIRSPGPTSVTTPVSAPPRPRTPAECDS